MEYNILYLKSPKNKHYYFITECIANTKYANVDYYYILTREVK